VYNYSLPPKIWFRAQHILCIGVISDPKKPKDFDSFFWPAIEKFLRLAHGLDQQALEHFWLRVYLIICFGDIPAVSMIMRIKGHNGLFPCQMYKITGLNCLAATHLSSMSLLTVPSIPVSAQAPLPFPSTTYIHSFTVVMRNSWHKPRRFSLRSQMQNLNGLLRSTESKDFLSFSLLHFSLSPTHSLITSSISFLKM
jgi:hypothetical protein